MANHHNAEYDSTDFQASISYYIHTIEELYKALEAKQGTNDAPSYSLSLQILGQILQQMKSLMERRLSCNALAELLSSEDMFFSQSSQHSSPAAFSTPFRTNGNMKEGDQINVVIEEETIVKTQREVEKKGGNPEFLVDNTASPPPWKPKK